MKSHVINAVVDSVTTNTDGYGETERIVGYKISAKYVLERREDEKLLKRTLEFTVPLEFRREIAPGDRITVTFADSE